MDPITVEKKTYSKATAPRTTGRLSAERVLERCAALPELERAFIRAIYLDQQTTAEVARIRGEHPRLTRRRLRAILARVRSPVFPFVVGHRARWAPQRRLVATAIFINGRTIRQAAREVGITYYEARRERDAVLAMVEAQAAPTPEPTRTGAFLKEVKG